MIVLLYIVVIHIPLIVIYTHSFLLTDAVDEVFENINGATRRDREKAIYFQ